MSAPGRKSPTSPPLGLAATVDVRLRCISLVISSSPAKMVRCTQSAGRRRPRHERQPLLGQLVDVAREGRLLNIFTASRDYSDDTHGASMLTLTEE